MKKRVNILVLFLLVMFLISGSSLISAETVLKAGHVVDPNHPYHHGLVKFGELLSEKTNGEIELEIYHSGQLGSERDMIEGLQIGTGIDVAAVASAPVASFVPKIAVFDLPYLFTSREQAYKVLDGPIGDKFLQDLEDKNIKGLGYFENGFRNITNSKRPIKTPEDLDGIKIRVMENPVPVTTFKAFGANPTPMAWGEVFTALQQGTIDAQENPLPVIYNQKLFEVQKYLSLSQHFYSPSLLLMSKRVFDNFSPEIQEKIIEAANEAKEYQRKVSKEQAEEFIAKTKEEGMEINEVNKELFQEASQEVYEEFEDKFGEDLINKIQDTEI